MVVQDHQELMSVEAFWEQYAGKPYELINGKVIEVTPAGGESPEVGAIFDAEIVIFVRKNKLGKVTNAEGGYWIKPGTLVAPDIAFYTWEKHKLHTNPDSFRPFPPDLAVEVVSPSDSGEDVDEKVKLYLEAGVKLVWVVYPRTRTIMVFRPNDRPERLSESDILSGGDVLPGFSIKVADCFPSEPPDTSSAKQ